MRAFDSARSSPQRRPPRQERAPGGPGVSGPDPRTPEPRSAEGRGGKRNPHLCPSLFPIREHLLGQGGKRQPLLPSCRVWALSQALRRYFLIRRAWRNEPGLLSAMESANEVTRLFWRISPPCLVIPPWMPRSSRVGCDTWKLGVGHWLAVQPRPPRLPSSPADESPACWALRWIH